MLSCFIQNLILFGFCQLIFIKNMSHTVKFSMTAILCELTKLKSQQKYLESTSHLSISSKDLNVEDIVTLTEVNNLRDELYKNILAFKFQLKNELESIKLTIHSFKSIVSNPNCIQLYNTKEYRTRIIFIDQTFCDVLKNNVEHLRQLKKEFFDLEATVLPTNYLLNDTLKVCPRFTNSFNQGLISPIDKDDNVDVKNFDNFVAANNGHTGNWNDEEHFLFLKLKTKYKENIDQIVMSMKHITTDKTEEEILVHNQWYAKYMELKMKKKVAIKNWKQSRSFDTK